MSYYELAKLLHPDLDFLYLTRHECPPDYFSEYYEIPQYCAGGVCIGCENHWNQPAPMELVTIIKNIKEVVH